LPRAFDREARRTSVGHTGELFSDRNGIRIAHRGTERDSQSPVAARSAATRDDHPSTRANAGASPPRPCSTFDPNDFRPRRTEQRDGAPTRCFGTEPALSWSNGPGKTRIGKIAYFDEALLIVVTCFSKQNP
jgi:hypothetical protein